MKIIFGLFIGITIFTISKSSKLESRIVGGNDYYSGESTVALVLLNELVGAGSILNENYIVTSASRVIICPPISCEVRVGSANYTNAISIPVQLSFHHPKYDPITKAFDVGIMRLTTPLDFTNPSISPISLLSKDEELRRNAFIAGWGLTTEYGVNSEILQEVNLPVISLEECRDIYFSTGKTIDEKMVCLYSDNSKAGMCDGDEGGPVIVFEFENFHFVSRLAGILSYSFKCGEYPTVVTSTQSTYAWITLCGQDGWNTKLECTEVAVDTIIDL